MSFQQYTMSEVRDNITPSPTCVDAGIQQVHHHAKYCGVRSIGGCLGCALNTTYGKPLAGESMTCIRCRHNGLYQVPTKSLEAHHERKFLKTHREAGLVSVETGKMSADEPTNVVDNSPDCPSQES